MAAPWSPLLYTSSATGPTHDNPGYTSAGGSELTTLEQEILTTMATNATLCRGRDAA
jgi:hypothetical protein